MRRATERWLLVLLLLVSGAYALAEQVTMVTYYPSPRGVYDQLRALRTVGIGTASTTPVPNLVIGANAVTTSPSDPIADFSLTVPGTNAAEQATLNFMTREALPNGAIGVNGEDDRGWQLFAAGDTWGNVAARNDLQFWRWDDPPGVAPGSWGTAPVLTLDGPTGYVGIGTREPNRRLEIADAPGDTAEFSLGEKLFLDGGGGPWPGTVRITNNAFLTNPPGQWNLRDATARASTIEMRNDGVIEFYGTQTIGATDWRRMLRLDAPNQRTTMWDQVVIEPEISGAWYGLNIRNPANNWWSHIPWGGDGNIYLRGAGSTILQDNGNPGVVYIGQSGPALLGGHDLLGADGVTVVAGQQLVVSGKLRVTGDIWASGNICSVATGCITPGGGGGPPPTLCPRTRLVTDTFSIVGNSGSNVCPDCSAQGGYGLIESHGAPSAGQCTKLCAVDVTVCIP